MIVWPSSFNQLIEESYVGALFAPGSTPNQSVVLRTGSTHDTNIIFHHLSLGTRGACPNVTSRKRGRQPDAQGIASRRTLIQPAGFKFSLDLFDFWDARLSYRVLRGEILGLEVAALTSTKIPLSRIEF